MELKGLCFVLGATPPWMIQEEEHSSGSLPIGPSYEEFLKESKQATRLRSSQWISWAVCRPNYLAVFKQN
jgi:hypothetical protein